MGVTDIENEISIYPNPSKNIFYITLQTDVAFDYIIFDLSGKEIMSKKETHTKQLDLSKFAKGVYFLKIRINKK